MSLTDTKIIPNKGCITYECCFFFPCIYKFKIVLEVSTCHEYSLLTIWDLFSCKLLWLCKPLFTYNINQVMSLLAEKRLVKNMKRNYSIHKKKNNKAILIYLRPGSNVVSADNMAATVKAWDKQPYLFASIKVRESEGSNGSSVKREISDLATSVSHDCFSR